MVTIVDEVCWWLARKRLKVGGNVARNDYVTDGDHFLVTEALLVLKKGPKGRR